MVFQAGVIPLDVSFIKRRCKNQFRQGGESILRLRPHEGRGAMSLGGRENFHQNPGTVADMFWGDDLVGGRVGQSQLARNVRRVMDETRRYGMAPSP